RVGLLSAGAPGTAEPGKTNGYTPGQWTFPSHSHNSVNFGQIRVDHNFSLSDSMFGRWTIDDDEQNVPSTANAGANATSGVAFPYFYTTESSRNQYLTVAE